MKEKSGSRKPQQVFLSYAAQDRKAADLLGSQLKAAGLGVWSMADDVLPGDNWGMAVAKALETCDAMVALVSPSFARSEHTVREVEFALTHPRYLDRLIPVMIRPTTRFPWILKQLSFIDATRNPGEAGKQVLSKLRPLSNKRPASTPA